MAIKKFGQLFTESFADYRKNFSLLIKIALLFFFLPTLIIQLFGLINDWSSIMLLASVLLNIGLIIITHLGTFSIVKMLADKKGEGTTDIKKAVSAGLRYLWKGIGLSIIVGLALFGLTLLLIVPGIIFSIYWAFAIFVLVNENTGIIDAMKGSKKLVKGIWWKIFGYILLLSMIMIAAYIITTVFVTLIIGMSDFITTICFSLLQAFITPFYLTFMQKFYLSLKKESPAPKK